MGSQLTAHNIYIVRNLDRNIILGQDWLQQNEAGIYFDLGSLCLEEEYITLEEDKHISSIAKIAHPVTLKPQFMQTCMEKIKLQDNKLMKS